MKEFVLELFKISLLLGGFCGFAGYLVGLCIHLLTDFGRG